MKTPVNVITESNEMNTNNLVELQTSLNCVNGTNSTSSATKSNNINMSNQSNNNINSPKMGSRRIFTPQFKLQVLESYRNDSDCKGNQRATARKYNIHRRQIQKWLQCESNLRSSVTNLNQNNIKHQFHNISRQTQQQQQHHLSIGSATNHSAYSNQQQQQHIQPLSLDNVRQRSNLNSLAPSSASNNSGSHEMFAATHLAAVVAAAAAAGASGAICTPTTSTKPTHSPLRPTALNGVASVNNNSTMPSSIMQQYSMVYSPAVAMTVPPVPILTHHLSQQHIHHQYQYNHNLSTHVHNLPTISEPRPTAFVPTVCLPVPPATTSTALLNDNRDSIEWMQTVGMKSCAAEFAPATADIIKEIRSESSNHDKKTENMRIFSAAQSYVTMVPIDLSIGIRRENLHEAPSDLDRDFQVTNVNNIGDSEYSAIKNDNNELNNVVDLTFRKRKSFAIQSESEDLPEKHSKVSDEIVSDELTTTKNGDSHSKQRTVNPKDNDKEDEIDVEGELIVDVDGEEKSKTPPLKPVKLFKPYLLDSNNEDDGDVPKDFKLENINEQKAPIIWSNHPECLSPRSFDSRQCSSRESYFQSPTIEKCPFPFGSPPLQKNQLSVSEHQHNNLRNTTPTTSKVPSSFCCPKGSPVSGYESSSSSYSENSFRGDAIDHSSRSYRFDLKMQRVYNESVIEHQSHIHRWLNHGTPSSETSSIILYA